MTFSAQLPHRYRNDPFARDVAEGLMGSPKRLSSKYFYDETGDALFQAIMALPEYYLTRCEYDILSRYAADFLAGYAPDRHFHLVELGAGDGLKTRLLLRHLIEGGYDFTYAPVDISANALRKLSEALAGEWPALKLLPIEADYFTALKSPAFGSEAPRLALFLGSNIGNYLPHEALSFYQALHAALRPGDRVLTGFDLQKNPHLILAAYNDAQGVTRNFNLNLLRRINQAFDGNFELHNFSHYPVYEPETGLAKSYLVSERAAEVHLAALGLTIHFAAGEWIFTEVSRKFTPDNVEALALDAGFRPLLMRHDDQRYFADALWER